MTKQVSIFNQPSISKEVRTYCYYQDAKGREQFAEVAAWLLSPRSLPRRLCNQTYSPQRPVWPVTNGATSQPRRRHTAAVIVFVAYAVTALQTQSNLRSLWTGGL